VIEVKRVRVNIDSIKVPRDRIRRDLGDITHLAYVMRLFGWVDDILVDEDYVLVAGQRRLEALRKNGEKFVWVDIVPKELAQVIEFLENAVRKELEWHEYVEGVYRLHEYLSANATKIFEKETWKRWTISDTAKALNKSVKWIHDILRLRRSEHWERLRESCKSIDEALEKLRVLEAEAAVEEVGEILEEETDEGGGEEAERPRREKREEKGEKEEVIERIRRIQRYLTIFQAVATINARAKKFRFCCPFDNNEIDFYDLKAPCGHSLLDIVNEIQRQFEELRAAVESE